MHAPNIITSSFLGVIARSLFYLIYWERSDLVNETNFENNVSPVVGGALVEVRNNIIADLLNNVNITSYDKKRISYYGDSIV